VGRGWYGFQIGDRVRYKLIKGFLEGEIIYLSKLDKNSGEMKTDDGDRVEIILERCEKI
jgi:hypothetical protein